MNVIGAGRYELGEEISRGAIGVVVRAVVTATGEQVAVKRLRPETAAHPESVIGFLSEAEILAQVEHPAIVRLRELLAESDGYALVLDLVEGADLRRRVRTTGPVPPALAASVAITIADALAYLHARGFLHGDIKPGNIVLPDDGSQARLVDFGVARRIGQGDRTTYATPEYVAPEVVLGGAPGPAADVYALGMVLYELSCGRSAYRGGNSDDVMRRHLTCVPVPPAGLAEPLWPVIQQCLAFDPARRPAAATVVQRLRAVQPSLAGLPAAAALAEDAVTWWLREADETAPVLGLQRVAWVPATRQNPESAAPERLVAVRMPDRSARAGATPERVRTAGPKLFYGEALLPLWPTAGVPDPVSATRSRRAVVLGVGALVLLLLALLAVGGYLLRDHFGAGPVAGPSSSPSGSAPSHSTSPGTTTSSGPQNVGGSGDAAPPGTTTPTAVSPTGLPTGLPSIGAPLPTFP